MHKHAGIWNIFSNMYLCKKEDNMRNEMYKMEFVFKDSDKYIIL